MARYGGTVRDRFDRPVQDADIYVAVNGNLVDVLNDDGVVLSQPLETDQLGSFEFNAPDGVYDLSYYVSGRLLREDFGVVVGTGGSGGGGGGSDYVLTAGKITDALGYAPVSNATVTAAVAPKANTVSPAFTGTPTAPTQTAGNNSTRLATTAFVVTAVAGAGGGTSAARTIKGNNTDASAMAADLTVSDALNLLGQDTTRTFSRFVDAPAIIPSPNTRVIDFDGNAVAGDSPTARYRKINTEPTHAGKVKVGDDWYQLIGDVVTPDHYKRTGDAGDGIAFQRALDRYTENFTSGIPTTMQLLPRAYDIRDMSINVYHPFQILGYQGVESSQLPVNANNSAYGELATGSWIITDGKQINYPSGASRGGSLMGVKFAETHPTAVDGTPWTPNDYPHVINITGTSGGSAMTFDRLLFNGINKWISATVNPSRIEFGRLKGMPFREALRINGAVDVATLDYLHMFGSLSFNRKSIADWMQANARGLICGRVDGFMIGYLFGIGMKTIFETEDMGAGGPSRVFIDKMYCDISKTGVRVNTPGITMSINSYASQNETTNGNTPSQGLPVPGSAAIEVTPAGFNGFITVSHMEAERVERVIKNASNTSISLTGDLQIKYQPANSKYFDVTNGGMAVSIAKMPVIGIDAFGQMGTRNVDWKLTSEFGVYDYFGVTGGNGGIQMPHGLGVDAPARLRDIRAWVRGESGEAIPMTFNGFNGTNFAFTSPYPGNTPTRTTIWIRPEADSW